ncbi:MAG: YihY/virulence factor BrkB family protein [Oscillospiraceae bacterium]|nr:YihY/virulence factor BrkB family protein [Oscillospiraceae bacterium]
MKEIPKGGLIGKTVHLCRWAAALGIRMHAAGACYFIVLAVFPALLLLLGLVHLTGLEVERLGEMLTGVIPEPLLSGAEELILLTYDKISASAIGLSALTTLWPASRGVYALMTGLNAVYGVEENRGYLRKRLLCAAYTFAFILVLVLTLLLHVFGVRVTGIIRRMDAPFFRFLTDYLDLRFVVLLVLQTVIFTAMFLALPNRRSRFRESVPGALLASAGWLTFSNLYSIYVEHFAHLGNIYGSVYAVALSMLWLYCCVSIVFYGGVLNRILSGNVEIL